MIRNIFFTGLALFSLSARAQFVPNNSQGFQFMSIYNPAFSGVDSYYDIKLGYRYQWAGIEGAPKSVNLSLNMRLKQPVDLSSNALHLSNTNLEVPLNKLTIHGLGVNIFQNVYGQVKSQGGGLNYAMNLALTRKLRMAAGVAAFIESTKIDVSQISVRNRPDPYYDILLAQGYSTTNLNVRAGVLLYTQKFYLGATYFPIVQKTFQLPDSVVYDAVTKASAQIGFAFDFSSTLVLKPSVLAVIYGNNSVSVDYNVKAFIGDKVWCGLTYRGIKAGVVILGFNINNTFTASYSYEMSLGKFKKFNDGSHEIVLAMRLNNFKRQLPYTW